MWRGQVCLFTFKKYFNLRFFLAWLVITACFGQSSFAQENTSYTLNNHIVYYNVFNSSLIPPFVARAHGLKRSKDLVYLNVAVVHKSGGNGIPADISGQHRNLIQQTFDLSFIKIDEPTATYYLAPIRFNNEDILHIDVRVIEPGTDQATDFTITKKLYRD